MTKICDFPLIYDRYGWYSCPKHNLWTGFVDNPIENDEKVASSKKQFNSRMQIPHPIYDQNS